MKKSKKTSSASSKEKQKSLIELLKSYGAKIYEDLDNGEFPKFSIPSRSVSNIVYDQKLRQYILGNNSAIRSAKNTSQLRSFTQLMWLAFFANRLTNEQKSSTLRDVMHPYTKALLSAVPIPDPTIEAKREHQIVKGEVPSPMNPPSGCVFHPRCPSAVDSCQSLIPEFREVKPGHWVACSEV